MILIDYEKVNHGDKWCFQVGKYFFVLPSKRRMGTFLLRNDITQRSLMNMVHLEDIIYGLQRKEV